MPDNYLNISSEKGTVHISEQVIAVITAAAIAEVEGAAGFSYTSGGELYELRGKKPHSKGIQVTLSENTAVLDITIMVKYGFGVAKVAAEIQKTVATALESMTGISPTVNVNVSGIAFKK